ncbi:MAG: FIG01040396: hypothetical protein, partial [uncultured Solirubrobacteraceae bacterium]
GGRQVPDPARVAGVLARPLAAVGRPPAAPGGRLSVDARSRLPEARAVDGDAARRAPRPRRGARRPLPFPRLHPVAPPRRRGPRRVRAAVARAARRAARRGADRRALRLPSRAARRRTGRSGRGGDAPRGLRRRPVLPGRRARPLRGAAGDRDGRDPGRRAPQHGRGLRALAGRRGVGARRAHLRPRL